jgi:hypothetical protein
MVENWNCPVSFGEVLQCLMGGRGGESMLWLPTLGHRHTGGWS